VSQRAHSLLTQRSVAFADRLNDATGRVAAGVRVGATSFRLVDSVVGNFLGGIVDELGVGNLLAGGIVTGILLGGIVGGLVGVGVTSVIAVIGRLNEP
jgi:hypothetical protein